MTQTKLLQVAEFLPDLPDFPTSEGSQDIRNVFPLTPQSYGPVGAALPVSNALSARCQGAAGFFKPNGNMIVTAGDASKLYILRKGDAYLWQDASRLAGGAYNVGPEDFWEFDHFNDRILATNYNDVPQVFQIGVDTHYSALGGSPPRAMHMAVIKNAFVMLGYINDGAEQPQTLRWSGAGDATNWATPGSTAAAAVQAGSTNLLGDDGVIQAIRGGLTAADALIFQQYGIRRCIYSGPPNIFSFLPAQNARGTSAGHSPVVIGGICYYLGYDGWYANDGGESAPIGANKIDKTFLDDIDKNYFNRVVGAADPNNKMVWWCYPGAGSVSGIPNRLLGYNWQLQRWCIAEVSAEALCRVINFGYTLDELWTILGYTLDNLPAPLDSSVWAGGTLQLGVFNTDHKLSYLTGPLLAPTVATSESEVIPGKRALITAARPLIDGGAPSVSIGQRQTLQQDVVMGQTVALNALGVCPVRTSGRFLRGIITAAAGGNWTQISGIELDIVAQGAR
jgi:hypothetical protein